MIVHSAGVVTPDFTRRHPDVGAKIGDTLELDKELILELERYYDENIAPTQSQEQGDVSLSPDVASFLDEMGERLDDGQDNR